MNAKAAALLAVLLVGAAAWPEPGRPAASPASGSASNASAPRDARLCDDRAGTDALAPSAPSLPLVPSWRTWDGSITPGEYQARLLNARSIRTGTITGPENHHLIYMEQEVRRVEEALRTQGPLSAPDRTHLHQMLGDAGQVIFFDYSHGRRPRLRPAVAARLESGVLALADAAELFAQFIRLAHVHRMLAGPPQSSTKRAALEAEYAHLAAQLFE